MSDEPTDAGAICFSRLRESNAGFTQGYQWEGVVRPASSLTLRGSLMTGWPHIHLLHLFKMTCMRSSLWHWWFTAKSLLVLNKCIWKIWGFFQTYLNKTQVNVHTETGLFNTVGTICRGNTDEKIWKRSKNNTEMIKRTSHLVLLSIASSCQTHWTQMPKRQTLASIMTHKFVFLGIHGCALMKRKAEFFDEAWTEILGPGIKVTDVSLSKA